MAGDKPGQEVDERGLLLRVQCRNRLVVRLARRRFHVGQHGSTGAGQSAHLRATILPRGGALDQSALVQALQRTRYGGPVKRNVRRQRRLVGEAAKRERGQQAVLNRCDIELSTDGCEKGNVDLMQPSCEEAGAFSKRPGSWVRDGFLGCHAIVHK